MATHRNEEIKMKTINNELEVNVVDAGGFIAFENFSAYVTHADIIDGNVEGLCFDAHMVDDQGIQVEGPLTPIQEFEIENEIEEKIMESWNDSAELGYFSGKYA
jgi:hypothetical protein